MDSIKHLYFFKDSVLIFIVDGMYVVELYTFSKAKPFNLSWLIVVWRYRIAGFFEGEYFHEFRKSSSVRENFTCENFKISTAVIRNTVSFVKILPRKMVAV